MSLLTAINKIYYHNKIILIEYYYANLILNFTFSWSSLYDAFVIVWCMYSFFFLYIYCGSCGDDDDDVHFDASERLAKNFRVNRRRLLTQIRRQVVDLFAFSKESTSWQCIRYKFSTRSLNILPVCAK